MPEHMPQDMPGRMPEDMPDRMPEDMSDRMPEDLPVAKCLNVMVGITRSKVILCLIIKSSLNRSNPKVDAEICRESYPNWLVVWNTAVIAQAFQGVRPSWPNVGW